LAVRGRGTEGIEWQMVLRLRGRTTLDECKSIIDRLEEFAALLTGQWPEFSLFAIMTESTECETNSIPQSPSKPRNEKRTARTSMNNNVKIPDSDF
jgi:hypothetical protein